MTIIIDALAKSTGLPSAVRMPAPAKRVTLPARPTAARPSTRPHVPRVERRAVSATTDDEPVRSEDEENGEGVPTPQSVGDEETCAGLDASYGAGDPLEILRAVESELAVLGALAETARPGESAEVLDVPGALGPTLSLAARRLGVAIDILELRPSPPEPGPADPPLD